MAEDMNARVSVLESQIEESTERAKEAEARAGENIEKAETRVTVRVEKMEKNLMWLVLLVVGAVLSRVLEKVGLG